MNQYPLPEGWRWARISEVCEKPEYGFTASAENKPIGPKLLRISDIQYGVVNWDDVPYCRCESNFERYLLKPGDILFARTGGTTGKSYLIKDVPSKSIFASYLIRLKTKENLFPEYLYLFLQSDLYWKQVEANKRGGAQPNLNATLLSNLAFPFPPLPEQRRIAAKIQELMQDVYRARVACEKQLEAAKALPAGYLRSVFESTEAKSWENKKLGKVCKVVTGSTPRTDDLTNWEGDILWATPNDMGKLAGFTIDNTERKITEKGFKSCSTKLLPPGSVLLTTRAPIGHLAINLKPICTNQGFKSLIPSLQLDGWFLFFYLKYSVPILQSMGRGQTFTEISKKQVENFEIRLPKKDTQHQIALDLKEKMADLDKLLLIIRKNQDKLNDFPQAIFRVAFMAKL